MANSALFTVVTCTYNRKEKLHELYDSLCRQDKKNFIWLIVDDWSTDDTEQYIKTITDRNLGFKVIYTKPSQHGGKYKAINYVLPIINTKLFILIDSDDYLVDDGSLKVERAWNKYKNLNIGSIIMEHGANGKDDPMLIVPRSGTIDYRYYYMMKKHLVGDFSDVFVTDVVNKFRFPEFPNETFMSENPMYYWMSQKYKSVFLKGVLTIGNYCSDGISSNLRKIELQNWRGTLYESNLFLSSDTPLWFRFKKAILYDYILIKKRSNLISNIFHSNHELILLICLFPAWLYSLVKE